MEPEFIAAVIDDCVCINDTDVSVGINDTTTIDGGDWKYCDDHNDSEDLVFIVVARGDTIDATEIEDTYEGAKSSGNTIDIMKGDTVDVTETGNTVDDNGSDNILVNTVVERDIWEIHVEDVWCVIALKRDILWTHRTCVHIITTQM